MARGRENNGRGGKTRGLKAIGQLMPASADPMLGCPRVYICVKCQALICEGDGMRLHHNWHWAFEDASPDEQELWIASQFAYQEPYRPREIPEYEEQYGDT